ncbi:MAG: alpha-mannosidase, partial [Clostridia bacterium]|nr:alpha-mannosidase [Clostridia bacterium]
GESLIRQIMFGKKFMKDEFGVENKVLWLPDVFGYSAALPQILRKCGIDSFFTIKINWNETDKFPHDTFIWRGLDGSEILAIFARNYVNILNPKEIQGLMEYHIDKKFTPTVLATVGYGDGGGGVTYEMLENYKRLERGLPGFPKVKMRRPTDTIAKIRGEFEQSTKDLRFTPKWSGELYLEYHRGTYTSQGRNKKNNRKLEIALRDVEFWLTRAKKLGVEYPQDELREIWRSMLTLQFHDILPGSSIHKVYTDSNETYADLFKRVAKIRKLAMDAIMKNAAGDKVFFNSLSHVRNDVVWFDAPEGVTGLKNALGEIFPVQRVEGKCVSFVKGLAPMGATHMWYVYGEEAPVRVHASEKCFETPFFKGAFNEMGSIVSLFDKENGREVVKKGEALNKLVHYENRPHNYDAWDINIYYNERFWDMDKLISIEKIAEGPVVSIVRMKYLTSMSVITQDVIFYADLKKIDFKTHVDWKEPHSVLKAHFPVDVFYNEAQFDIQYGNVKRATHKNTSWDVARFEVCAHKWADVSEPGYGVAIMNDCKYGHSVDENGIALTLVKSATNPDPTADQEEHEFTYAIYPHAGDWREANVPKAAYEMNIPVDSENAGNGDNAEIAPTFATVNKENIMIETVKGALHGEGTILRMYECFGKRTNVTLSVPANFEKALFTSLMEDDEAEANFENGSLTLTMKPYEIVTIRLV